MNTPDDEPVDEVTSAYRRASEAEAGGPASSTRAAILAEARAAALRRTPAANQSLYAWRAVAGIAVIGVAVLLWRQADRSVTPELTVETRTAPVLDPDLAAKSEPVAEAGRSAAQADRTPEAPQLAAAPPRASADVAAVAESTAKVEREESKSAERERDESSAVANVPAAAPAATALQRARSDAAPALAAGALRQAATDYQGLLQREFPEVWNAGTPPRTVWLVMNAEGSVASKGVLSDVDTLASVSTQPSGAWTVVQVRTASGSSLQLAVMQVD